MERQWQGTYFIMAIMSLTNQQEEQVVQPLGVRSSSDRQAPPDRSTLSGALVRLAAVFACAGIIQLLASWFLR
jgi:hypothetical protein